MPDARMLFYGFSKEVQELENTIHLVHRDEGGKELSMEIQGTLMAIAYANVFRTYHLQITGKEPRLRQYGLTLGTQERVHRAETQRLSPTISFDDVYLALALDDL